MNFLALGMAELVALALEGRLPPRTVWYAMKGAGRYFAATRRGDVAPLTTQAQRVETCMACPYHTERVVTLKTAKPNHWANHREVRAIHCGKAFVETASTCGCLVACTISGRAYPAGKSVVLNEKCPQNRW